MKKINSINKTNKILLRIHNIISGRNDTKEELIKQFNESVSETIKTLKELKSNK